LKLFNSCFFCFVVLEFRVLTKGGHKMKAVTISLTSFLISLFTFSPAFSHCEIPCGIYGDETRFAMLEEDITTVEKSMKLIVELSKAGEKNYNQLVRWIDNKEKHANLIQETVSQYFMTQRIKPADENNQAEYKKYMEQLSLLHEMLIYAMKAKQTTDLANVEKLRALVSTFKASYFGSKDKK
jgi:nickel superoxide dismutase